MIRKLTLILLVTRKTGFNVVILVVSFVPSSESRMPHTWYLFIISYLILMWVKEKGSWYL